MTFPPDPIDDLVSASDSELELRTRASDVGSGLIPTAIGRFRVLRELGRGGFGTVYLALDDELRREVAVKVPHRSLVASPEQAEPYLREARTLAGLDHPHIVPLYDVGQTDSCPYFLVSKYIAGVSLRERIKQGPCDEVFTCDLIETVARALHYAHAQGVVHRDIKPGNILIDVAGQPHLVDFGLALTDADRGSGSRYGGTPQYMSPEQARGEGHRVDGRSDIFSLGVVLYEMLTRRRPFQAPTTAQLLQQLASIDPQPPRQIDASIPRELERICLRAMARRVAERYTTAADLADELAMYRASVSELTRRLPRKSDSAVTPDVAVMARGEASDASSTPVVYDTESQLLHVVPKGLRSFDGQDADFFLALLPGPRDRHGLPESLRFWKARIESTDATSAFPVGLLYGPSGCGKSSLVKAGLLPQLGSTVHSVYIEAGPEDTVERLKTQLARSLGAWTEGMELNEIFAELRHRERRAQQPKTLIVIDQFEQWLHGWQGDETELVRAIRQCNGTHLQSLLLVRDDFWMASTRFFRAIEVRIVEGENSAAVDLFDVQHARKVLRSFGRAFERLPVSDEAMDDQQRTFVERAVDMLAEDHRVICVRLSLFAEMMKWRSWDLKSLADVGGAQGIGVSFLEEHFGAKTSPPQHRYHQQSARRVLNCLLPEEGIEIKRNIRSYAELFDASRCSSEGDFKELLEILSRELRLISPADQGTLQLVDGETETQVSNLDPAQHYYQLTHDYLVPSLRNWLTAKQRESRRGRADLKLRELATRWQFQPLQRNLPTAMEFMALRFSSTRRDWTAGQTEMMRAAAKYHGSRWAGLSAMIAVTLIVVGVMFRQQQARHHQSLAASVIERLEAAEPHQWLDCVTDFRENGEPALAVARARLALPSSTIQQKFNLALALASHEQQQHEFITHRLLQHRLADIHDACTILQPAAKDFIPRLIEVIEDNQAGEQVRFRAAFAVAALLGLDQSVGSPTLASIAFEPGPHLPWIGNQLNAMDRKHDTVEYRLAIATLRPIMLPVIQSPAESALWLTVHRDLLVDPQLDHILFGGPRDLVKAAQSLEFTSDRLVSECERIIRMEQHGEADWYFANRQARVALAMMMGGQSQRAWQNLAVNHNELTHAMLIRLAREAGLGIELMLDSIRLESSPTNLRTQILMLANVDASLLRDDQQMLAVRTLNQRVDACCDSGVRSAYAYLSQMTKWQDLQGIDTTQTEEGLRKRRSVEHANWYKTSTGHVCVVVQPSRFTMGSPQEEVGRTDSVEGQEEIDLNQAFVISAHEVTRDEFYRALADLRAEVERLGAVRDEELIAPDAKCPAVAVSWYEAAAYCNWLSSREGIAEDQWCYVPNDRGVYASGMRVKENFLGLTGYRLPTEAEWEYACRAGSDASRYFGSATEFVGDYEWHMENAEFRTHIVGTKMPNPLGLFDMLGNVAEWCHDPFRPEYRLLDNDEEVVYDRQDRARRGLSFRSWPQDIRVAARPRSKPDSHLMNLGFRIARTWLCEESGGP